MSFLLDTNVVSEWVKPRPEPRVVAWLAAVDEDRVFISVVTLAELRHGIDRLAPGSRRARLEHWLRGELPLRFEGRVLPIDAVVADTWGEIVARRERAGRPMIPRSFWIISLMGSAMVTSYFIWGKNDSVGVLTNLLPASVSFYNLVMDIRSKRAGQNA